MLVDKLVMIILMVLLYQRTLLLILLNKSVIINNEYVIREGLIKVEISTKGVKPIPHFFLVSKCKRI